MDYEGNSHEKLSIINQPPKIHKTYVNTSLRLYVNKTPSISSSNDSEDKNMSSKFSSVSSSWESSSVGNSSCSKNSKIKDKEKHKIKQVLMRQYSKMHKQAQFMELPNVSNLSNNTKPPKLSNHSNIPNQPINPSRSRRASIFTSPIMNRKTLNGEESKPVDNNCWEKFKSMIKQVFDSPIYIIIMSFLTMFAILGSDIEGAWLSPNSEMGIDVVQMFIFISFLIEIILTCFVDEEYILSWLFWLDIVSIISLLLEVSYIDKLIFNFEGFSGSAQYKTQNALNKISIASGTTRVLRILRIIKLIRIVKIYKTVYIARENLKKNEEKKKEELKKKLKAFEKKKKIVLPDNSSADWLEGEKQKMTLKSHKGNRLSLGNRNIELKKSRRFSVNILSMNSHKRQINQVNNDIPFITGIKDVSEDWLSGSKINKIISERINNLVFFLVLIVLLISPFLTDSFFNDDNDLISYQFLLPLIENLALTSSKFPNKYISFLTRISNDSSYPLIKISYNNNTLYFDEALSLINYRDDERRVLLSRDNKLEIMYSTLKTSRMTSLFNLIRSIFVCVLVAMSIWDIDNSTKEHVWEPLEVMMEIIDNLVQDPANAKNVKNLQSGNKANLDWLGKENNKNSAINTYEIHILKNSIIKISVLLSIGFGKLGSKIITRIWADSNTNTKIDSEEYWKKIFNRNGKNIAGVYFQLKIDEFNIINTELKKQSIILFSHWSDIIYNSIELFGGDIKNNFNGVVSGIWKFNPKLIVTDNRNYNNSDNWNWWNIKSNYESEMNCLMENMTELALFSCLHMINKFRKKSYSFISDWNNKMLKYNISLHLATCIEGFAGGESKIDVIHILENKRIWSQLQNACYFYGVEIIFSENVFDHLSGAWKPLCRHIDTVLFSKNGNQKYRWYTLDWNLKQKMYKYSTVNLSNEEKEVIQSEKKEKWFNGISDAGSICNYLLTRPSFHNLWSSDYPLEFHDIWKKGWNYYWCGKWKEALPLWYRCSELYVNDSPTQRLIRYIEEYDIQAPEWWAGARVMY